ncbi:uncharacterized protein LOC117102935 [Anneissia japonica]|uniref:uncharacterized protein LOC117102935 n=1 Tax=Anneissia japonica TaxID=1529436 RepID=UPI0014257111|nr:uncharacterized protein LOC117102935 [Anneissia japonica]
MSDDLETDTLLTNTGTGTITSNDYAKLKSKCRQLELENQQLTFERDFWKKKVSCHESVEKLTIELKELTLHSDSSQQNKTNQVLRQQFSTDGHNSFQSHSHHSQATGVDKSEVSLPCSSQGYPPASAQNSLSAGVTQKSDGHDSFQSDQYHSQVTLGYTKDVSLPCSPEAYPPASAQNSFSTNASVTQKSKNQTQPIPEEPPQLQQPGQLQQSQDETKGEMVLAGGGGVGGFHLDKPGMLTSFQPQETPTQGTPTQVTSRHGNTAVVPAHNDNPAVASVSRKRNRRSIQEETITDEMIIYIEGKVIIERKDLARKLGLPDCEIDEIEVNYRNDGVREIVHQLLKKWRQVKGICATVGAMLKALNEIKRKDLFDKFCDEFHIKSNTSDEDIPDEEQSASAVPHDTKLQQIVAMMPIQVDSEHDIARCVVPSIKNLHQKSEPAPLSNFDSFFSDFMLDPSTKGKKQFRKDLDKKKNLKRDETKQIASEMEWDSEQSDKFDLEVKANLKVSNVLEKWAGILLNENPHLTRTEKREHIQEMVRSLRGEKDGREDVIGEMRKHLLAGTVGTQADPTTQYTDLPYGMRYRLVLELNMLDPKNGGGCSLVAERLGIENNLIRYLTTRPEPGHQVLRSWETQADATVGKLYEVLIDCNAMKAVAVLE